MALAPGTRLGPYEVLAFAAAGGMGEVYRARDTRLERTVALKVLPPHLAPDAAFRSRFEREAKAISALSHPHICVLYDVGHAGDIDFLVMEYLEGETLAARLAKGRLPFEQVLECGLQIAGALSKAHGQGIVHRDLKPGNIMLTKTGVKLLDFGLAKAGGAGVADAATLAGTTELVSRTPLTNPGTLVGTYQYMAPEQLDGLEADARSDIWALGCVLHEMATGQPAFLSNSPSSLIAAIATREPTPVSSLQPLAPAAFDRLVLACLAKDRDERWQSAHDVRVELRWIVDGAAGDALVHRASHRTRREWVAWGLAGVAVVASAVLAGRSMQRPSRGATSLHAFLQPPASTEFEFDGDEGAPAAISPDGMHLVYGAGGHLWIQDLATGKAEPMPSTDNARFPFWSPDSRDVGFFADGQLKTVAATGGPVRSLCAAPDARGGAWGPDGTIVFTPSIRAPLSRIPAAGGPVEPFTTLDLGRHTSHRWPAFLPDGRHVIFLAANVSNPLSDQSSIYVAALDDPRARLLLPTYGSAQAVPGWLLFVQATSLMAQRFDANKLTLIGDPVQVAASVYHDTGVWRGGFSASQNGAVVYQPGTSQEGGQLEWRDRAGAVQRTIGEREAAYSPRLSPDGKRALVALGAQITLWTYDLSRGVKSRLATSNPPTNLGGVWSPDGASIATTYSIPDTARHGSDTIDYALTLIASSGSATRLLESPERIEPTDWSADGRFLLVNRGEVGATDIWAVPVDDPGRRFAVVATPANERQGTFSPDGRWIAYSTMDSGRSEVYVTAFPAGGERTLISSNGGRQPRWQRNGLEIDYVSPDNVLMAARLGVTPTGIAVEGVKPLFKVNLYMGPRTSLYAFDVAPDGEHFLVNSAGDYHAAQLALILDWPATLEPKR